MLLKKIIQQRPLPESIELPTHLHPVIRRVLAARNITDLEALDYKLQNLLPYHNLIGIDDAVKLLTQALTQQARMVIVADFDADGATSCALAVKALRQMGAQHVDYLVPNREKHGYGLTPTIVTLALAYRPQLLITVDNGISSIQGVAAAKHSGMQVLITDHHLSPAQLPAADAIVNPNQKGDTFPSKHLAGVGVIFYVMMALRAHLRESGWFQNQPIPNLAQFLDLVALGTVADVVKLDYNNRILVDQGLQRIRADYCCAGIRALIQVSQRAQQHLAATDLAFSLGPRLNAAGRMDDMSYGIACLLSEDDASALRYAQQLEHFNQERRFVETDMQQEALTILASLGTPSQLPRGLCLFEAHWHQGVIGILAARIKDRLHRPVIVFTQGNGDELKGSARSVVGVHIRDVLDNIATQYPQLLTKFGGHAMAAGLSLPRHHFKQFRDAFDHEVRQYLPSEQMQGVILTDGLLTAADLNLALAEQLKAIGPFGQGFPEPIFAQNF
ncbi:MAG: single-stranded-DNA-specific exonuclease RecJ, partial [Pseudomonadota bacterium]|nr:single-stranded-DNA-specific exonuclease RecJ [Pseudomonadota bacterium]